MKNSGYLVVTKSGKRGRTYHSKEPVNGKLAVYLETEPYIYSDKAVLCVPETVEVIGHID